MPEHGKDRLNVCNEVGTEPLELILSCGGNNI